MANDAHIATKYIVDLKRVAQQKIGITLVMTQSDQKGQIFKLPAWIPGSYLIRDFAKNIVEISAQSEGQPVRITKLDKLTWRCDPCDAALEVKYEVYAGDLSVRGAHADLFHAYFNGPSVFLMPEQNRYLHFGVQIEKSDCAIAKAKVVTALPALNIDEHGFGTYVAKDYDMLIDNPFEIGHIQSETFIANVPHTLNFFGHFKTDLLRIRNDAKKICLEAQAMFQDKAPFERYDFLVTVLDKGYGGLEHENCSSLICSLHDMPVPGDLTVSQDYEKLLGLISHEYFHAWLVKRIKPEVFMPYPLWQETYTDLLWVFEGFTAYYDDLLLLRSGLLPWDRYLALMSRQLTQYFLTPGRLKQSLSDSSFDAWIKFYQPNENSLNTGVSYYQKGSLLALCLDVAIRRESADTLSLDDLLRLMWKKEGMQKEGLRFDRLLQHLDTLLPNGTKLGRLLQSWVTQTDELPIEASFQALGVAAEKSALLPENDPNFVPALGVKLSPDGLRVSAVLEGSAAALAGLIVGDDLLALNEFQIDRARLHGFVARFGVGEKVLVHFFRRGLLNAVTVNWVASPFYQVKLVVAENQTQEVQERAKHFQQSQQGH